MDDDAGQDPAGDAVPDDAAVTVVDAPEAGRYEVRVDGALAGFAEYRRRAGVLVFTHTEVDPAYEGRGLGGRLVGGALAEVAERGERIVPECPFVASYLERHPELAHLVDAPAGD